ncbi:MAG: hypothetical protein WBG40_08470, partial [Candidatus Sulfotelmatobacter sp.]
MGTNLHSSLENSIILCLSGSLDCKNANRRCRLLIAVLEGLRHPNSVFIYGEATKGLRFLAANAEGE